MGGFARSQETSSRAGQAPSGDFVAAPGSEADAKAVAGAIAWLGIWRSRRLSHGQWQVRTAARAELSSLVDGLGPRACRFDFELVLGVRAGSGDRQSADLYQPRRSSDRWASSGLPGHAAQQGADRHAVRSTR